MNARQGGLIRRDLAGRADEPRLLAAHALHAGAAVAIADGVGPFGVLAVYSEDATAFAEETLRTLDALACLAAAAVEGTRRAADLDGERDERVRLASLVEGSADAIVSATLEGTILAWNPGAERLYGYPAHEILGQDVSMLIPAEREADRRLMLERVRAGARIPAFDATHRRKDGSPVTVSLEPLAGEGSARPGGGGGGHRARRHGDAAPRVRAPAAREDGGGRSARRRARPRLQQHAHGHRRLQPAGADEAARGQPRPWSHRGDSQGRRAGGGPDSAAHGVQPQDHGRPASAEPHRRRAEQRRDARARPRRRHQHDRRNWSPPWPTSWPTTHSWSRSSSTWS